MQTKKIFSIILAACLFTGFLRGNENESELITGEVSGVVVDATSNEPIPYASVALLQASDMSLITGVISDDQGQYLFSKIPMGTYAIKVSFIGYKSSVIKDVNISRKERKVDVAPVVMESEVTALDEVTVTKERLKGEEKVDRTVFTINDDIRKASTSGIDMLKHIPSVTVDFQDNVTLEGQSNIQFYVDGVLRNKDFVAQLNPEVIDKVELITNPGVKYDSDIAGVINIVLKKERTAGVNGSVLVPLAHPEKTLMNPRGNIEFGNKKMRIYVGDRLHFERFASSELLTTRIDNSFETPFYYEKSGHGRDSWRFNYMNYGVDFFISEKTSLNFLGEWRRQKGVKDNFFSTHSTYMGDELVEYYESTQNNRSTNNNHFHSAYFKHIINDEGSEITAELNYYTQTGGSENTYSLDYYNPEDLDYLINSFDRLDETSNLRNTLEFKSDYSFMVKQVKNEVGVRLSQRWMSNDFAITDALELNEVVNDEFHYNENWSAAYYNLVGKVEKFSWQAGIRMEYTNINIQDTTTVDFMTFLPQVSLSRQLEKGQTIKLSFRRMLYKPSIGDLNPFESWQDSLHIRIGNPELRPAVENRVELSYAKNFGANYIGPKLYFRYTENAIQDISRITQEGITEISRANIGQDMEYGISFSSAIQAAKFLRINSNISVFNRSVRSDQDVAISENAHLISCRLDGTIIFFLPKEFYLISMVQYGSPNIGYQREFSRDALFIVGFEKQIGKTMKLSAFYVPFASNFKYSAVVTDAPGYHETWEGHVNAQHLFAVEFTYNFSYGGKVKKIERNVEYDTGESGGTF